MKIGIIGGGIGGLALANCFQQFNIPYTLFERASKFGEVGGGIELLFFALLLFTNIYIYLLIINVFRCNAE